MVKINLALDPYKKETLITDAEKFRNYYTCLKCGEDLIVVKGKKLLHHYRHTKETECDGQKPKPKTELPEIEQPEIVEEKVECNRVDSEDEEQDEICLEIQKIVREEKCKNGKDCEGCYNCSPCDGCDGCPGCNKWSFGKERREVNNLMPLGKIWNKREKAWFLHTVNVKGEHNYKRIWTEELVVK